MIQGLVTDFKPSIELSVLKGDDLITVGVKLTGKEQEKPNDEKPAESDVKPDVNVSESDKGR